MTIISCIHGHTNCFWDWNQKLYEKLDRELTVGKPTQRRRRRPVAAHGGCSTTFSSFHGSFSSFSSFPWLPASPSPWLPLISLGFPLFSLDFSLLFLCFSLIFLCFSFSFLYFLSSFLAEMDKWASQLFPPSFSRPIMLDRSRKSSLCFSLTIKLN